MNRKKPAQNKKKLISDKKFKALCQRHAQEAANALDQIAFHNGHLSLLYSKLDMICANVTLDRAEGLKPILEDALKREGILLRDNFESTNVAYRTTSVRRHQLVRKADHDDPKL